MADTELSKSSGKPCEFKSRLDDQVMVLWRNGIRDGFRLRWETLQVQVLSALLFITVAELAYAQR